MCWADRRQNPRPLQHALCRQHLPRQSFFQTSRLIKRLRRGFENGLHDVVWIAAIEQVDVEIQPAMGHERLEKVFK